VFAYPFHFGKSGFSAYFFHAKSGFFVQVRMGPIYCLAIVTPAMYRPIDENKNAVISKRLRDGVMCSRLKIHSR